LSLEGHKKTFKNVNKGWGCLKSRTVYYLKSHQTLCKVQKLPRGCRIPGIYAIH